MPLRAINSAAEFARPFPGPGRHVLQPPPHTYRLHIKQKRAPETGASPAKVKSGSDLRP
jgi:hypothetical protein